MKIERWVLFVDTSALSLFLRFAMSSAQSEPVPEDGGVEAELRGNGGGGVDGGGILALGFGNASFPAFYAPEAEDRGKEYEPA
jgi:hypothetical protein